MDKKIFIAVGLSFATVFLLNHYFTKNNYEQKAEVPATVVPGQAYKVPSQQDLAKPINKEIDFVDKKITQPEDLKEVQTDFYNISFSNYGASVANLEFRKHLGKNKNPLRTIQKKNFYEKEEASFLLALDEMTPFFYNLVDYKEEEGKKVVSYQTENSDWIIKKTFSIYNDSYKIDLNLDFVPKSENAKVIKPRLFLPAPFVGEIVSEEQNGVSLGTDGKSVNKILSREYSNVWVAPSIFGAEDKYFVHTLVADNNFFTQRAFYKTVQNKLYSIMEGSEIKQKTEYKLSFYMGPKVEADLVAVEPRLEDLLAFGWLSWFCKIIIKLLAWLFSFFNNYGLAIILLALLIKIPFAPLTMMGTKKIEEFQKHQPNIARIRLKYKNDIQMQQAEMMKYYRDHNISPSAPIVGCLPLLIQMPILFALNRVLNSYLDLYQAPFFGWVKDLSEKDPYYILPLLMFVSMVWQQLLTPVQDDKQKIMMFVLPIILTATFINFPAGLVLYWFANNIFTIGENYLRKRFFK